MQGMRFGTQRERSGLSDVRRQTAKERTSSLTWLGLFFGTAVVATAVSASITGSAAASNAPTQAQAVAALQITELAWH